MLIPKNELFRKSIHIGGIITVPITIFVGIGVSAGLVIGLTILYLVSEVFRLKGIKISWISKITERAARDTTSFAENSKIMLDPVYLAIGVLGSLLIFPDPINYVAVTVVTFGDGFSSLVGKKYGKHHIIKTKKTVEGTCTGIGCAFAISILFVAPEKAAIASIAGMIVEFLPVPINDNITVPLIAGASILY